MSYTNAPIHDLLIRIKNAYTARISTVDNVTSSLLKVKVLDLLVTYKFIDWYTVISQEAKKFIRVDLKKFDSMREWIPVIKFFSKPSRRIYVRSKDIKAVAWQWWIGILSTNQWVMAAHIAKAQHIWWELIAEIY